MKAELKDPLAAAITLLLFLGFAVCGLVIPRKIQRFFLRTRAFRIRPAFLRRIDITHTEYYVVFLRVAGALSLLPVVIIIVMFLRSGDWDFRDWFTH